MSDIPADWRGQGETPVSAKTFQAYAVTRISDGVIVYIGITTQKIERRIGCHCSPRTTRKHYALSAAIHKYGRAAFSFTIVACATSAQNLNELERLLIAQYGTLAPNGYNLTTGGNQGFDVSEETRARISAFLKTREWSLESRLKLSRTTKGRPGRTPSKEERQRRSQKYLGRKATEETRKKMSAARKGRPGRQISEAEAAILRTRWVGRKHSAETRKRMSKAHIGLLRTAVHCTALSAAQKGRPGRPLSPEAKQKLLLANLGRPCSPETRAKISATKLARRA